MVKYSRRRARGRGKGKAKRYSRKMKGGFSGDFRAWLINQGLEDWQINNIEEFEDNNVTEDWVRNQVNNYMNQNYPDGYMGNQQDIADELYDMLHDRVMNDFFQDGNMNGMDMDDMGEMDIDELNASQDSSAGYTTDESMGEMDGGKRKKKGKTNKRKTKKSKKTRKHRKRRQRGGQNMTTETANPNDNRDTENMLSRQLMMVH